MKPFLRGHADQDTVDMSVGFDEHITDRASNFHSIRDSFYLLNVMNQYVIPAATKLHKKEAEGLLRIALFSKDLRLIKESNTQAQHMTALRPARPFISGRRSTTDPSPQAAPELEEEDALDLIRQDLAHELRAWRRRGVVPVYVSMMWFLFSLVISLQSAFNLAGQNAQAHDLALGLSLSWPSRSRTQQYSGQESGCCGGDSGEAEPFC